MKSRPRTSRNGGSPDETLRQLLQLQALAQMQIAKADERVVNVDQRIAHVDERIAKADERSAKADERIARAEERIARAVERGERLRQENNELFLRLMQEIGALKLMLERLPEAVREKIGFGASRA